MYRIISAICLLSLALPLEAQPLKRVQGEYIYVVPGNVSLDEAKRIALYRAQIKALADEFGTLVSDYASTVVSNKDGKSSIDFTSLGNSIVKGEWIETTGTPEIEIYYDNESGSQIVRCRITGKAREISSAPTLFKAKILRNGTDAKSESTDFRNNDDIYMSFTSPSDGYIAVYLIDSHNTAYCLLPYRASRDGYAKIEANTDYILFSKGEALPYFDPADVDEYTLFTDKENETNYIYIIYSRQQFIKAADEQGNSEYRLLPRELGFDDFQNWLAKNRIHDKYMQVEIKPIRIMKQ